ncbi:HNH endonuclease signature motif containing protein [uncultured Microbacterium sp.]|uniref:HNH endonuclease signature motif containing protein n=1 Tax=uncultured Microbacterium sp. TaxID=191216 RepID=UPI00261FAC6F|nr:HNH endonuclease signature motif containing protein [uncultured Microbacterium sp.]
MTFIEDMRGAVDRLSVFGELSVEAAGLPASVQQLSDDSVRALIAEVGQIVTSWQTLQTMLAGVVAQRSTRDRGHGGMAATGGFRTPVEMVRVITGVTKGEATRAVKIGEALLDGVPTPGLDAGDAVVSIPWHAPLREAMLSGRLTQAQYDAIHRGLGEPPVRDESDELVEAWRLAAEELSWDAPQWTVEQLRDHARTLRDMLDEEGAQERLRAQYDARSIRLWRDADGRRRGDITFDPEMGEWFEAIFGAALRPRRGGPRFVAEDEKDAAAALTDDPRTNEQLAYDLFIDVVRAGALADAKDVFGAREPGVRLIVMKDALTGEDVHRDALGRLVAIGHTEDGGTAVDGGVIERALCLGGSVDVVVDTHGKPLNLGRTVRTYSSAQRLVLAVRDGGCMWPGCDRPPAMTEAHHIVPWSEGGCTDVDDGILLCRYHHMHLHFWGWAILRDGAGRFLLVPPPEAGVGASAREVIRLESKSALRWLWDPPPDRPRWRHARVAA